MLKAWLRLVRLPLAPTAACDVVACTLLAFQAAGHRPDLSILHWVLLPLTSVLIYAFGMADNDLSDVKVDRVKNPDRPLPSGQISVWAATAGLAVLSAAALVAAGELGAFYFALSAILLALLYNQWLKRYAVLGAVNMGCVRFANAALLALPMVLDGAPLTALIGPLCIGLYSMAVTLLSTTEDDAAPRRILASRVWTAVAFAGAAAAAWWIGGLPTLGVCVAFGVATSTLFGRTPKPGPAKKQVLEMLLGLYWLAAVLVSGWHDRTGAGSVIVGASALAGAWVLAIGSQLFIRFLRPRVE